MPLSVTKGQGEPSGGGEDHQMTVYSKAENGQNGTAVNPGEQAGAERVGRPFVSERPSTGFPAFS